MTRVAITGIGPVSSIGIGKDAYVKALYAGKVGITQLPENLGSEVPTWGKILDFDPEAFGFSKREKDRIDPFSQYAVAATQLALEDAGLLNDDHKVPEPESTGIAMGVAMGGMESLEFNLKKFIGVDPDGKNRVLPHATPAFMANAAAAQTAIRFGVQGATNTYSTACASGGTAIASAYRRMTEKSPYAPKVMLAGGTEATATLFSMECFRAIKALSKTGVSRPFDKRRDGFVMSEGAGMLVLEDIDHAQRRGAPIYGFLQGYGETCDAYHITAADGKGLARAIRQALVSGETRPTDVQYICAHGTSTELNDSTETAAIKDVFGEHAYKMLVAATKSQLGHAVGGAAPLELIATLGAMQSGFYPVTVNPDYQRDDACDLEYGCTGLVRFNGKTQPIIKTCLGFGGHNVALNVEVIKHEGLGVNIK